MTALFVQLFSHSVKTYIQSKPSAFRTGTKGQADTQKLLFISLQHFLSCARPVPQKNQFICVVWFCFILRHVSIMHSLKSQTKKTRNGTTHICKKNSQMSQKCFYSHMRSLYRRFNKPIFFKAYMEKRVCHLSHMT